MFLKQMGCDESNGMLPVANLGSAQHRVFIVPHSR
jgi:hypothetical protein